MKKVMGLLAGALLMMATSAMATPNLVTNGSFEDGLNGWTYTGTGTNDGYPAVVIQGSPATSYPTGAFGENIPVDNIVGGSPDLAGSHGAYFVSDTLHETLSQILNLSVGLYEIGFDTYSPLNGFNNRFDASLNGSIAGEILASFTVHTSPVAQWTHFSGIANVQTAGSYAVNFDFQPNGFPSADVVIDRVYVVESAPVPEPGTLMLLGAGFLGLAVYGKRRKSSRN